ncbi:MAG: hypothetical protein JJT75_10035 [Opitutales bacterium]|nr:hypothetical protein [Opitutales bacterium]MCH8541218.1 M12 family metallo-peptidase [Opitutales bacterium]
MKISLRLSPRILGFLAFGLISTLIVGHFFFSSPSVTTAESPQPQSEELPNKISSDSFTFIPGGVLLTRTEDQEPSPSEAILHPDPLRPEKPLALDDLHVRGRVLNLADGLNLQPPPVGQEADALREFVFDLFTDVQLIGQVERLERHHANRVVYSGPLTNVPGGDFILAYNEGHVAAAFTTPGMGYFQLRPQGDGTVAALELDLSRLPPCTAEQLMPPTKGTRAASVADIRAKAALHQFYAASSGVEGGTFNGQGQQGGGGEGLTFTVIDMLIVFTENATSAAGGLSAMEAIVDVTFARANSAFINSEIGLRLQMVRSEEVAYTEVDTATSLHDLTNGYGAFSNVPIWRNESGADLVALIFDGGGGRAWIYNGNANFGYSVNGLSAIEGTFIHEIGHNLGCLHDRENNSISPVYPYSYGWRFTPEGSSELRTIMAYAPGNRIPYFSNPEVTYMGTPSGVPIGEDLESHNAEVIRDTKASVAAFRSASGNVPPTVTLESPVYDDPFKALDTVSLTASASDSDGTIEKVWFYRLKSDADFNFSGAFSTSLGFDATAPYGQTETSAPAGFWTYAAVAQDNDGAIGIDTVSVTVAPHYRRSNLPLPGEKSRVNLEGINEAGRLVGFGHNGNPNVTDTQAAYWEDGDVFLLDPLSGDTGAKALAVSQEGIIFGESISSGGNRRAVQWDESSSPTDLSGVIDDYIAESAMGVDEFGRVYLGNFESFSDYRRFDDPGSTTTGGNQHWEKVASTGTFAAGHDYKLDAEAWRAMRWEDSGTQLSPVSGFTSSWGRATNRSGAVFGVSSPDSLSWSSSSTRLTFWPAGSTTPTDLGTFGAVGGVAYDLNDWNEAVGQANDPESGGVAFIWRGEGDLIALADLILPQSGLKRDARVINNRGQIAGTGFTGSTQFIFFLDPMPGLENNYWLANHFDPAELEDDILTDDAANPSGDGLSNLLKRAVGLDPRVAASGADFAKLPQGTLEEDGHYHFRFRRLRAPRDIAYQPEGSLTLGEASWDENLFEEVGITFLDNDYEEVHLRTTFPITEEDRAFARLRLSR